MKISEMILRIYTKVKSQKVEHQFYHLKEQEKFLKKFKFQKKIQLNYKNADAPQSNDAPTEEGGVEESNEVSLDEIAENDQQEADNSENSEQ